MKKLIFSLFTAATFLLTGCYDLTQEITLNADGSGTLSTTNDMSALIMLAKQMGGAEEMAKAGDQKIDSTFSLKKDADSMSTLSESEKMIARTGSANIMMNLKDEKFRTTLQFPFSKPAEVSMLNTITGKIMGETMKNQMGGIPGGMPDEMPEASSLDDYYTLDFTNGELTRKVNKDKYKQAENDEYLKAIKEAGAMGLDMTVNYIINLPRPASKAEGKNLKISDDKKKVTISASIDDFFEDPSSLEFKIKY